MQKDGHQTLLRGARLFVESQCCLGVDTRAKLGNTLSIGVNPTAHDEIVRLAPGTNAAFGQQFGNPDAFRYGRCLSVGFNRPVQRQ